MSGGSRPHTQRTLTPRPSTWLWVRMRTTRSRCVGACLCLHAGAVRSRMGSSVGLLLPAAECGSRRCRFPADPALA
eukprot:2323-Pleurochrysis_carterae.AAC.1